MDQRGQPVGGGRGVVRPPAAARTDVVGDDIRARARAQMCLGATHVDADHEGREVLHGTSFVVALCCDGWANRVRGNGSSSTREAPGRASDGPRQASTVTFVRKLTNEVQCVKSHRALGRRDHCPGPRDVRTSRRRIPRNPPGTRPVNWGKCGTRRGAGVSADRERECGVRGAGESRQRDPAAARDPGGPVQADGVLRRGGAGERPARRPLRHRLRRHGTQRRRIPSRPGRRRRTRRRPRPRPHPGARLRPRRHPAGRGHRLPGGRRRRRARGPCRAARRYPAAHGRRRRR
jgi:hypothetical protein